MNRLEKNKKKALIVFGFLFLVFGGGVSVFFMSSGIEDLKGFDKKSKFSYGFGFKKAAMPFFEYLGFTDGEDTRDKSEISLEVKERFDDGLQSVSSAGANTKSSANSKAKAGDKGKSYKPRRPRFRMSSKNRGINRGRSGSKSSLAKSSFSKSDAKKDINITETGLAAKEKLKNARAYTAMRKTNNLLAQTHKTNSSMDAKSKWDKSFIGGGAARGKMAYKGSAVELDEMSPSILDLKEANEGTLAIPEVGAPKKDAAATAKDPALEKLKNAANPIEGLLNSMMSPVNSAMTQRMTRALGSGPNVPKISDEAQNYASEWKSKGESARITIVSCDTDATFCAENEISENYYKVAYTGNDDNVCEREFVFIEEDGVNRDILINYPDGSVYDFDESDGGDESDYDD